MIAIGFTGAAFFGPSVLLQSVPLSGEATLWAIPVAYVASVVFVLILLASVGLILSALRQRRREE